MGIQILMTPVADVTALLGTGRQFLDMSGRWALMQSGERIIGAVDMNTGLQGASFSWTAPNVTGSAGVGFTVDPYRNNIPLLLFDSGRQRFCGVTGTRTASNNPEGTALTFMITDVNGKIVREPGFSGNLLGTEPTIETPLFHVTDLVCWQGQFWGLSNDGIGDAPISDAPTLIGGTSEDTTINWLPQGTVQPLPTEFMTSYTININGNTSTGANSNLVLVLNEGVSNEQRAINVTELDSNAGDTRAAEDFPGWGSPIMSDQTCTGLVLPDVAPEVNYNFQLNFVNELSICGWDGPGGTAINFETGLPDHTQSANPSAFDIEIGSGGYFTPLFPTEFTFNGTLYKFGTFDGVIRALTVLNGNVMALAEYNIGISGEPGLLLMMGGVYQLSLLKSDTLNWKMSLTYGMQGPGTQSPSNNAGLYATEGAIGLGPEASFTATSGTLSEDYLA